MSRPIFTVIFVSSDILKKVQKTYVLLVNYAFFKQILLSFVSRLVGAICLTNLDWIWYNNFMKKDDKNTPIGFDKNQDETEYKTPLYKRVLAIIAIAFVALGAITMTVSFLTQGTAEQVMTILCLAFYGVGGLVFVFLYMSGSMPLKREKQRQQQQIRMDYYRKVSQEQEEAEQERLDKERAEQGKQDEENEAIAN